MTAKIEELKLALLIEQTECKKITTFCNNLLLVYNNLARNWNEKIRREQELEQDELEENEINTSLQLWAEEVERKKKSLKLKLAAEIIYNTKLQNLVNQGIINLKKINTELRETEINWAEALDDWQQSQEVNGLLARWLVKTNKELKNERSRADNLQNWKDNHVCSAPCPHADYDTIQQERDNWKKKSEEHVCPSIDNSGLENLRQEGKDKDKKLVEKDQKIAELEAEIKELKNKPPIQPANSELNNLLTEKENLLATIQEKVKIIQQLEVRLKEQPKEVIKEVENGEVIQGLKAELSKEQQSFRNLSYYSWFISGVSIVLLVSWIRLLQKKKLKKHHK